MGGSSVDSTTGPVPRALRDGGSGDGRRREGPNLDRCRPARWPRPADQRAGAAGSGPVDRRLPFESADTQELIGDHSTMRCHSAGRDGERPASSLKTTGDPPASPHPRWRDLQDGLHRLEPVSAIALRLPRCTVNSTLPKTDRCVLLHGADVPAFPHVCAVDGPRDRVSLDCRVTTTMAAAAAATTC